MSNKNIRAIAIYLPQYHPIPENDKWWGKGFTEWTNVAKAKPLFKGHYQPHLPADLGFYDLRVPEVREQQAQLAKEHGIYGFCYYHYWFNGKRMLERPFEEVYKSGKPDFPFMLCWANENWTRSWDGGNNEILLQQNYSVEDDKKHIQSLIPYFKDDRYIKINGKPVIAIYRSTIIPDVASTIKIWREEALKEGLELYLCRFESFWQGGKEYLNAGFDASIDFQPMSVGMKEYQFKLLQQKMNTFLFQVKKFLFRKYSKAEYKKLIEGCKEEVRNEYKDYEEYVNFQILRETPDYKLYPCVFPMWDNTARQKKNPGIFVNATPSLYKKWLSELVKKFKPFSKEENLIFINAWNEWAEGNHLEPCQKWGTQYLKATLEVLKNCK